MKLRCRVFGHKVRVSTKGEILCLRCKRIPETLGIDLLREYINSGHTPAYKIPEECKHVFKIISIDPRDAMAGVLTSGTKFSTCTKCGYYPTTP